MFSKWLSLLDLTGDLNLGPPIVGKPEFNDIESPMPPVSQGLFDTVRRSKI